MVHHLRARGLGEGFLLRAQCRGASMARVAAVGLQRCVIYFNPFRFDFHSIPFTMHFTGHFCSSWLGSVALFVSNAT